MIFNLRSRKSLVAAGLAVVLAGACGGDDVTDAERALQQFEASRTTTTTVPLPTTWVTTSPTPPVASVASVATTLPAPTAATTAVPATTATTAALATTQATSVTTLPPSSTTVTTAAPTTPATSTATTVPATTASTVAPAEPEPTPATTTTTEPSATTTSTTAPTTTTAPATATTTTAATGRVISDKVRRLAEIAGWDNPADTPEWFELLPEPLNVLSYEDVYTPDPDPPLPYTTPVSYPLDVRPGTILDYTPGIVAIVVSVDRSGNGGARLVRSCTISDFAPGYLGNKLRTHALTNVDSEGTPGIIVHTDTSPSGEGQCF